MHRRKLLQYLEDYRLRFPEEAATVDRFVAFVEYEPRCFERDCWRGHVTGSAWLVDPERSAVLLTHHRKLNIWVQLGGHSDGDPDTLAVARREAEEESGLTLSLLDPCIYDIDIHEIPARKSEPAHYHFDVRFAFVAASSDFVVSAESMALAWVEISRMAEFSGEESLLRMGQKWFARG